MAPSTELLVPELQKQMAGYIAQAMVTALKNMQPAKLNFGLGLLSNVTHNRRAFFSPYVSFGTIDPHLAVLRIDDLSGKVIATLWNFAIHGICYDDDNLKFSSDNMGIANTLIEQKIGGVSFFINADAGDINPNMDLCNPKPIFKISEIISDVVINIRNTIQTSTNLKINMKTVTIPFGNTNLNATLQRFFNCTTGGILDICTICTILQCELNEHLPSSWVENRPRFSAARMTIDGKHNVLFSLPGEAIVELGWWIRNDTIKLGFDGINIFAGYTNSYMGYFSTPREYDIGGYESQMTFWGIETASRIRESVNSVLKLV